MSVSNEAQGFDKEAAAQSISNRLLNRGYDVSPEDAAYALDELATGATVLNFIIPLAEKELIDGQRNLSITDSAL